MSAYLHAFGKHLPSRTVTNAEIAARIGKTPEWIRASTGIEERRWASPETSVADLAIAAAEDCLRQAPGAKPQMIFLASGSSRPGFPGPAAEVAARLGCDTAPALDVPMASAGSLFALAMAAQFAGSYEDVLVLGAEKMSEVLAVGDSDPNTAILFGDGAGAALIRSRPGPWKIRDSALHSDGQFRGDLVFDHQTALRMNGLSVILQASRKLPAAISEVLTRQKISPAEVSQFILHQANQNLLVRVARAVGAAEDRFFSNIARYGNTSSASLLIAAAEWAEQSAAPTGPVVFAAFGAGFHWGALVASPES